ncbi:hypothetical protein T492DRAFT_871499 [Pavlovales sp. CCMP2436]|nr:hypothetical protein T492DRAFT_871499 [Pavlovales sp. CCMP2436]
MCVRVCMCVRVPSYGVLFREFELLGVEEGHVTLNSGGERTPLMFAALNTALAPFGYRLTEQASKPGEWMVAGQSKFMRFSDGLVLHGAARFAEQGAAAFASQAHGAGYGHGVDGHYGGDDRYGGGRGGGGRGGGGRGGGGRGPYVQRQMIPQHQEEAAQRRPRQPQPGDAPMATQSSSEAVGEMSERGSGCGEHLELARVRAGVPPSRPRALRPVTSRVPFSSEDPPDRLPHQANEGATAAPARLKGDMPSSGITPGKHHAGLQPGETALPAAADAAPTLDVFMQDFGNHSRACVVPPTADFLKTFHTKTKDAAKALREQKKQKEAAKLAELEGKFVLFETAYACGVAPCKMAKAKRCPTCCTIAESGRACGKVSYALQRVGPWQRSAPTAAAPAAE